MKLAIVQVRSGSSRLPAKALRPLAGEPMILRLLERVQRSEALDRVVVATTSDPADDPLAEILEAWSYTVRRGPVDDVLTRFLQVVEEFRPDTVVRLTGDNPLVDPDVIDMVVREHREHGADYTSNSRIRSFPYGLDVECVSRESLLAVNSLDLTAEEREHVTLGIYSRPETFTVHQVTQLEDQSVLRWSVDYPIDFEFVSAVYDELYANKPAFGQVDVLELLQRRPEMRHTIYDVPS